MAKKKIHQNLMTLLVQSVSSSDYNVIRDVISDEEAERMKPSKLKFDTYFKGKGYWKVKGVKGQGEERSKATSS